MKIIIQQLKSFVLAQHWVHWLVLMVFCGISVYINYGMGLQEMINNCSGATEYFAFVALYAVHTVFAYLLFSMFTKNYSYWTKPGFLVLLFASFFIFAIRAVMYRHHYWVASISDSSQAKLNGMVFNDVFRWLYLVIPLLLIWVLSGRDQPFYGVSLKNHHSKVYWYLLLCMVPLIVGASFLSDFLDYYPRFTKLNAYHPATWKVVVYEVFYGIDFSSIELFFRGFMVMAFTRYVGMGAILPMATFYLSIHYGKPMGEAISSFFGGTVLGVIAYHSKSIFGGIMVHAGIAWLMELGGYIGNLFRQ